ncbi:MAG: 7-cyano-7-deazaguanine synthase, partial [Candidatus Hydrothermarchaeota archaeon]|nr:7-cyano-7-deazaguanine synthase [Candidatus Hydrothermarchaeota archaeon]
MKGIVVMSGGLDSTTLLYWVIKEGYEPYVLSFDYGQRHRKELEFAEKTCRKLKV